MIQANHQPTLQRNRFFLLSCSIIFVAWSIIQCGLLFWYGTTLYAAIIDSLISAAVITIACYVISSVLYYYQPQKEKTTYILVWVISLTIIVLAVVRYAIGWVIASDEYQEFLDYSLPLRFLAAGLLIGCMAVINVLWNIQQNNRENENRKADTEKMAREAELYSLRQKLQPHFLFNSLNSIIALITQKPELARTMVFQLSDFLRGTLHMDDQQLLDIDDELEHLQLYIDIEKVRFGHRLNITINKEDVENAQVPAMIIQPLLENAIKYGLYNITGQVDIQINIHKQDNLLNIRVKNPFDPDSQSKQKSSGFGLRSIERRLFLIYGRTDLLHTNAGKHIFTATISIPQPE